MIYRSRRGTLRTSRVVHIGGSHIGTASQVRTAAEPAVPAWNWAILLWHTGSVALIVLVPPLSRLGLPFWELPERLLPQVPALAAGYLGTALVVSLVGRGLTSARLLAAAFGPLVFGAAFLFLVYLPGFDYSRLVVLVGTTLGTVLAVLPSYLPPRGLRMSLLGLAIAVVAAAGWSVQAPRQIDQTAGAETRDRTAEFMATTLHNLRVEAHTGLVGPSPSMGGAIVAYGDAFIVANGIGDFYWLHPTGEAFSSDPMDIPAPFDRAGFLADNSAGFEAEHFRIVDLLVDSTTTPDRLLVSHYHWEPAERCLAMRISSIPIPEPESTPAAGWEALFTTRPCVPVERATGTEGLTNHSGGRMAWAPAGALLFSVGDLGVMGPDGRAAYPQALDNDYGKILALDPEGRASIYSSGLRNPQGLLIARDGTIWETEHGPTGGDELNIVVSGADYGWPRVSYGAEPGARSRGSTGASSTHGAYVEPVFSWLPSVGVSNLIELEGEEFPEWAGDLMVASLNGQSLFRIRARERRVLYAERLQVGGRLRDLVQDSRGRVLVWRDDTTLLVIANAGADRTGEVVFSACATCHEPVGGQPALAPDLRSLYGKRAGSNPAFEFSDAFANLDFVWSPERLDTFLANPVGYVPGTQMDIPGLSEEDRAAVTDYLWGY